MSNSLERSFVMAPVGLAALALMLAHSPVAAETVSRPQADHRVQINAFLADAEENEIAHLDVDALFPLAVDSNSNWALSVQSGAFGLRESGGRQIFGAAAGLVYRSARAGGVFGVNAFYDWNRIDDDTWSDRATHHRVSLGVDYQDDVSHLAANYYHPISDPVRRFGSLDHHMEIATKGADLQYNRTINQQLSWESRIALDLGHRLDIPLFSPADVKDRLTISSGANFRVSCSVSLGLQLEHDFLDDRTTPALSASFALGSSSNARACRANETASERSRLFSVALRDKWINPRVVVTPYVLTELSASTTDLYHVVEQGHAGSDTVWLVQQGGPISTLDPKAEDVASYWTDLAEKPMVVNVHQIQTYNPRLFDRTDFEAVQQVQAETDLSVEIMHRVIRHFKDQGKKVVVFSHSFGSFVTARYLALKGPAAADQFVIMAGRLDMTDVLVRDRIEKLHDHDATTAYNLKEDGITPVKVETPDGKPFTLNERLELIFQGALGQYRYTSLLADTDLSKVIYAYGTGDQQVGRLTEEEIRFLEARNAQVVEVSAMGGGHGSMVDDPDTRAKIRSLLSP